MDSKAYGQSAEGVEGELRADNRHRSLAGLKSEFLSMRGSVG
jgi:hypothetical protein